MTRDHIPEALQVLKSQPLIVMKVEVAAIHATGGPAGAERRVADVSGGSFTGDRLSGIILPGGVDWLTIGGDGATLLDARFVLRTDDDALIAMSFTGIRHGPPEVIARLNRSEPVDPSEYYFRIVPRFTTAAPRYEWLNRVIAVGIGDRQASGPVYSIFEIV